MKIWNQKYWWLPDGVLVVPGLSRVGRVSAEDGEVRVRDVESTAFAHQGTHSVAALQRTFEHDDSRYRKVLFL